jgi:hypothetical protein
VGREVIRLFDEGGFCSTAATCDLGKEVFSIIVAHLVAAMGSSNYQLSAEQREHLNHARSAELKPRTAVPSKPCNFQP